MFLKKTQTKIIRRSLVGANGRLSGRNYGNKKILIENIKKRIQKKSFSKNKIPIRISIKYIQKKKRNITCIKRPTTIKKTSAFTLKRKQKFKKNYLN